MVSPPPDRPVFLYVESDGMVYLVRREGRLAFPREGETDPAWRLEFRGEMDFPEGKVLFAVPELPEWPRDWTFKDSIPPMQDVDPLVQRAVNASLVREVVGGLVFHPEDWDEAQRAPRGDTEAARILLVKSSRGFTKGMWNIPGGFVTYAEAPEEGMRREAAEETGLDVHLEKLLGVFTQKFGSPYYMRGHMYLCRATHANLRLQADEIADAQWFSMRDARRLLLNPFARRALDALEKGRGLEIE